MYILSNSRIADPFLDPGSEASMARARAGELLRDASRGLVFDPEQHRYWLGGRELRSVSSIVEQFAPFDAAAAAERCSKNPRHEHFGKSPEQIMELWDTKGREASAAGTQVHSFAEACMLFRCGRQDEIEEQFRDRLTPEGLAALTPKEEAAARWWDALDLGRYAPVAKEVRLVNPCLGYAGTFDLLLYDSWNKCYALKDYKTNADLFRWFGGHLKAPLSPIKDNDEGKYTVQQNMYGITLGEIGLAVGTRDLVWLREDGSFSEVPLPNMEKLVRFALETLNKQLQ